MFNLMDDLGKGLGPYVASLLMLTFGRTKAFNIGICAWFLCAFILLFTSCTIGHDEAILQTSISKSLRKSTNPKKVSTYVYTTSTNTTTTTTMEMTPLILTSNRDTTADNDDTTKLLHENNISSTSLDSDKNYQSTGIVTSRNHV